MTCMQCKHMTECKDDAFANDAKFCPNESAKYCTGFEPYTNADRIRAMSDEELALFICNLCDCIMVDCPGEEYCKCGAGEANGLRKWLQQPAGEE